MRRPEIAQRCRCAWFVVELEATAWETHSPVAHVGSHLPLPRRWADSRKGRRARPRSEMESKSGCEGRAMPPARHRREISLR